VWRTKHRLQQLERELATARAERAELRRRLDWFETIAAAAGASRPDAPTAPVPLSLVAAASGPPIHDTAVQLDVAGTEIIAVLGGAGDPREWWTAIRHIAGADVADEVQAQP
jgi:hypothetical protein